MAGVPPDTYARNGQLWGNPLYDWHAHRATGFRWWVERFRRTLELVDLARIDHFRGLVAYWAVPAGRRTARVGRWRTAPGRDMLLTVRRELGELPVIAEDLGVITPAVNRLRDDLGLPGMVVMQWAFDGGRSNPHTLANHRENQVVYASTHDTDTTAGWYGSLPRAAPAASARSTRASRAGRCSSSPTARARRSRSRRAGRARARQPRAHEHARARARATGSWRLRRGQLTDSTRRGCAS